MPKRSKTARPVTLCWDYFGQCEAVCLSDSCQISLQADETRTLFRLSLSDTDHRMFLLLQKGLCVWQVYAYDSRLAGCEIKGEHQILSECLLSTPPFPQVRPWSANDPSIAQPALQVHINVDKTGRLPGLLEGLDQSQWLH